MYAHCRSQACLQILPSQFLLLTIVSAIGLVISAWLLNGELTLFLFVSKIERLASQGSLGGINALLGCPLHLPSTKVIQTDL